MFSSYVVYGLGISGLNLAKYLIKNDKKVFLVDDNEKSVENAKNNLAEFLTEKTKFILQNEIEKNIDEKSVILFSPGIPLHFPMSHKILEIASRTKAQLICDVELFYLLNRQNKFIGITGTNGKSTTSALTDFILREIGMESYLAGNIGIACFDLMLANKIYENKNFVLEVSSYQIDLMNKMHFDVAALMNITPDHIDRHGSFENYIAIKKRIFQNQGSKDFAVINVDNENSRKIFTELRNDVDFKANLIAISTQKIIENGVFILDGILHNNIAENKSEFSLEGAILKGEHNMENIAVAFACVYLTLLKNNVLQNDTVQKIIKAILKFGGLKHRMQFLGNVEGIAFINDSKATNAESAEKALKSYNNIFWILGGVAKEGGISSLIPYFSKLEKVYLIGKASDEFGEILQKNNVKFEKCGDLKNAFKKAFFDAKNAGLKEKNILLSPACASFDQWKNFEERGDYFCKMFDEIKKV